MIHNLLLSHILAITLAGPPPTAIEAVTEQMHGHAVVDDYRWLESLENESEAVRSWTTTQNDYTRGILDSIPGRGALEARLGELMSIGSVGTPVMRGKWYFYLQRDGDQNQSILYVRTSHDGTPRVLLDPNTLDERGLYALDFFAPSQDGALMAFGLSHAGDEMTVLYLMDVATGRWLADEISGKIDFYGWSPDGTGFLYGRLEDPEDAYSRSFRYHDVGSHPRQDPMLFMNDRPERQPSSMLSRNGKWIISTFFEGWSIQDLFVTNVRQWRESGEVEMTPIAVDYKTRFAPMFVEGNTLYMLTTLDAPNAMLYAVNLESPQRANWKVVIPERADAVLKTVDHAKGMIIASYEKDATSRITRFDMSGHKIADIQLPGIGSAGASSGGRVGAGLACHHDRTEAFYAYTSFNEPTSIYRIDLSNDERELWARPDVPVDGSDLVVKQEWCTSADGTRVPMFIVHRKGLKKNGSNPALLYGYGGFNVSLKPRFGATDFPWLENGGVYVMVTLRGGGEYGESWHQAGMLDRKQNVFDDLYAAAEYLHSEKYTSPEHLAVLGGSNGGLLTGVAATQRPELWAAAVSAVPLLDMLRYQHLLMAKFWVPEYGDPADPEHFTWLRAYSPYHNIKKGQRYPAMLFTAGENDNRVHPMHARKMAAAMQANASNDFDEDPIMLWVDREGGHGQGKPLHLRVRDIADRWSFIMWQTGMYYGK